MIIALLLLQAAAQAPTAQPQRWSILAPTGDPACERRTTASGEILVCAETPAGQRLPPLDEVEPGATPNGVNPYKTGAGALAAEGTPCAASQRGCLVGFGPPIVPIIKGAVGALKSAFAAKPDKRGRVPIPLD